MTERTDADPGHIFYIEADPDPNFNQLVKTK